MAGVFLAAGAEGTQTAVANGDTRTISFYHTHSKEKITVTFKKDGRYDQGALKQLNHFLRDWRNQKEITMEPRLFDVVWEVQKDAGSKAPVQIISAYRSPETNNMLRSRSSGVAKHSQHTLGHAMDIHLPDVNMAKVREAGLRLQRGGVGFYPTSALPFVHLDVGSVRMWPRMTREQLVRVFPDGRTVHLPTDGKPLKNYALAMADVRRGGAIVRGDAPGATQMAQAKGRGFLSRMLGGDDEDETPATAAAPAPVETPDAPSPAAVAIAEAVPLPVARPTEVASMGPQLAAAYASQQLPSGPDMIWRSGPDASAGRAATSYEVPTTTPGMAGIAMPVPRPADTTPAALVASGAPKRNVINPAIGAPVTASLMPGGNLADERTMALRMLNSLGESAPQPAPQPRALAAIDHIAAAHDAFAPQQTASATAAPTASFSPLRTARDRSLVLSHPNLKRTAMAAPARVLPSSFGGNPNSGMRSDAFVGASIAVLRTMTFDRQRTAELGSPRG